MYNIGMCKICRQGLLEIVKDEVTEKIFICCDECEAEWDSPLDALCMRNGTRDKYKNTLLMQGEINGNISKL